MDWMNGCVIFWPFDELNVAGSLVSGVFIGPRVGASLDGVAVLGAIDVVCWLLVGLMVVWSGVAGCIVGLRVGSPLD